MSRVVAAHRETTELLRQLVALYENRVSVLETEVAQLRDEIQRCGHGKPQ